MTKLRNNQEVSNEINGDSKNPRLRKAIAATALMVAGLGVAGQIDKDAEEINQRAATEIVDNGTKGAAPDTEDELNKIVQDLHEQTSTETTVVDPASKEHGAYKNSEAFANNDGQAAVKAEQDASQPEAEIGDATAAVKGSNGETIYVDPVTGEPLPDQPEG